MKILIVEDDANIVRGLKDNLAFEGYAVSVASDGEEGLAQALSLQPDLILLDIMMPKRNGFDVLRELRDHKQTVPVIMLTCKGEEVDKVLGLELGADDYVTKPFGLNELLARIRAVLRRRNAPPTALTDDTYAFEGIEIRFARCEIARKRKTFPLTAIETALLRYLVERRGKVVTREELLNKVWGYDRFPSTRTVDNRIMALRKKLGDDPQAPRYLVSMRSLGYRFDHESR
ncbi:MAG: response regulator transcription factor [bacterium]